MKNNITFKNKIKLFFNNNNFFFYVFLLSLQFLINRLDSFIFNNLFRISLNASLKKNEIKSQILQKKPFPVPIELIIQHRGQTFLQQDQQHS